MTASYIMSLKDTRMNAVTTAIDANAAAGFIEIGTAAMATVLVAITLSKPSFTESAGVLTMAGAPKSGTASATGTAAAARIKDGGAVNVIISGLTVGTSGTDIVLNSTAISSGETVTLNSLTITHSP
jgi:hypothetical protein